jgi:beta-galactosidase
MSPRRPSRRATRCSTAPKRPLASAPSPPRSTTGFLLNGERVPLNGVCDHHDLGALGTAINVRALERQLEILQAMGCNAIRTSHNPPAPELLELCDRMGFLVMDEAFDCWAHRQETRRLQPPLRRLARKGPPRPGPPRPQPSERHPVEHRQRGPRAVAGGRLEARRPPRRHRPRGGSHPARRQAFNNIRSGYNGFQTAVDIVGYNYKPFEYARLRQVHPQLVIEGSETSPASARAANISFRSATTRRRAAPISR